MYPEYERIFIISQHFCRGVVKARQIQNLNLWQKRRGRNKGLYGLQFNTAIDVVSV